MDDPVRDRAELPPGGPRAADGAGARGSEAFQEIRDRGKLGLLDLAPILDLLARVDRAERAGGLAEQERERVEEWRRAGGAAIRDPCEESLDHKVEAGLLASLAHQGVVHPLAMIDPAGRQAIGAARIERLDRKEKLSVRPPDDHAYLAEAVRSTDRVIEAAIDRRVDRHRRAESSSEVGELRLRVGCQLHAAQIRSARACAVGRPAPPVAELPPSS